MVTSPTGRPYLDGKTHLVIEIPHAMAAAFLASVHYAKGTANTSVARHGLFDPSGTLRGVALWMPPLPPAARWIAKHYARAREIDPRGVLVLSRLACAPFAPANATGYLLGRSMRLIDRVRWPALLTFADTSQGHTGTVYRATNWDPLGESAAGDTWVHAVTGAQRGRRAGGCADRTADEMRADGFVKRAAAPKIRFGHVVDARGRQVHP